MYNDRLAREVSPITKKRQRAIALVAVLIVSSCGQATGVSQAAETSLSISRADYHNKLYGFWLGQSIANWTGLVTEMDKIGGEGLHGEFYTRESWGQADHPNIWSNGQSSHLSATIDWVLEDENGVWGADDDTDIEYLYQHLLLQHETSVLSGEQIRDGWLKHIYSDENTPFTNSNGEKENYLWVSNQRAHDLMRIEGMVPPATGDPDNNPDFEMIDAQLTTEIFGLFAPGRPDVAIKMAHLPIRTTAREDAARAAEFYVVMYSLASKVDRELPIAEQIRWMSNAARKWLPDDSYTAKMFDFVKSQYESGKSWEAARDAVYQRYQVEQMDGYDITSRNMDCNGCFASGVNFAASIVSLLYGEGDYQETVKIAVLSGWDSDNPAATWGGLLGFMLGKDGIEKSFGRSFSSKFNIHRTRGNFANNGIDTFEAMADNGLLVVDRVVQEEMGGVVEEAGKFWRIPITNKRIALSFDDAPKGDGPVFSGDDRAVELLDALARSNVEEVVFFVTTSHFEKNDGRERVESYAAAGHLIANHSHSHLWANRTDTDQYIGDIYRAEALLDGFDNRRPWFRFPFLDEGRETGKRDAIRAAIADRGLMNGYVTIDNYDWYLDAKWKEAVDAGKDVDVDALQKVYVEMLLGAVNFYNDLAETALGSSPAHVLLLHENDVAASFIDDLVVALREDGWSIIGPDEAYADPIAARVPETLLTGQGHVAALAIEAGVDNRTLTHLAIEEDQIDALLAERDVFRDKEAAR